ncbi:glycosyltransferase [Candidatus Dojkabacteria bacterium]|nr:glycosyltransferase [Candidatus Dojkabacteria bacterium]
MKVAIATDSLVRPGGADELLKALLKAYPKADIFTSVYNANRYSYLKKNNVHTSFIQGLPFRKILYRHYTPLSPIAFEQFDFSGYDLVLSISAGCAKGVITGPQTFHLGIICTPPRYQWGGISNTRASRSRSIIKSVTPVMDFYLRVWDLEASKRPNELVSISNFVSRKVKKVYRRESHVVHPGVDLSFWNEGVGTMPDGERDENKYGTNFYLVVSRLYDYKRIDLAVEACNRLNRRLIVVGEGPDAKYLKSLAGPNVTFLGYCSTQEKKSLMSRARAFLFPGVEDFGLTPVESMACGTPVIAYNKGGVAETVIDKETGVFFDRQTVESLCDTIRDFETMDFDRKDLTGRAREFSENLFLEKIKNLVNEGINKISEN